LSSRWGIDPVSREPLPEPGPYHHLRVIRALFARQVQHRRCDWTIAQANGLGFGQQNNPCSPNGATGWQRIRDGAGLAKSVGAVLGPVPFAPLGLGPFSLHANYRPVGPLGLRKSSSVTCSTEGAAG
jgi:hypothetical protein